MFCKSSTYQERKKKRKKEDTNAGDAFQRLKRWDVWPGLGGWESSLGSSRVFLPSCTSPSSQVGLPVYSANPRPTPFHHGVSTCCPHHLNALSFGTTALAHPGRALPSHTKIVVAPTLLPPTQHPVQGWPPSCMGCETACTEWLGHSRWLWFIIEPQHHGWGSRMFVDRMNKQPPDLLNTGRKEFEEK